MLKSKSNTTYKHCKHWLGLVVVIVLTPILVLNSCKNNPSETVSSESTAVMSDSITTPILLADSSSFKKLDDAYILPWSYLLNTKLEKAYSDTLGMEVSLPTFSDTLLWLNHKNVIVEGFYIPVDETGDADIVILSAYPFTQCFFCGKAGVESIIDVLPKEKLSNIKMDQKLKMKGRLKLNREDFNYLIFMLEDAVRIKD